MRQNVAVEESWRDGFVAAMQRKQVTNTEINDELQNAAEKADDEGKTPQGALGAPADYAASLDYPDKGFIFGEALAGAALLVGAFLLSDGLIAVTGGTAYRLTLGAVLSWALVFGAVLLCIYLAAKTTGWVVLGAAVPLLLIWVFLSNAPTPALWSGSPAVPIVVGVLVLAGAFGYVGNYLRRQNANPIRDPDSGEDIRFGDQPPSFVQLWGPLVYMAAAVAMVVVFLLI